jgi:hypothetical protein
MYARAIARMTNNPKLSSGASGTLIDVKWAARELRDTAPHVHSACYW